MNPINHIGGLDSKLRLNQREGVAIDFFLAWEDYWLRGRKVKKSSVHLASLIIRIHALRGDPFALALYNGLLLKILGGSMPSR